MKYIPFYVVLVLVTASLACSAQNTSKPGSEKSPATSPASAVVSVDDSHAAKTYANFSRVTGTAEELIIDLGLNPQPFGVPKDPIVIDQRIIVNYYTAKRLVNALQLSIDRHEKVFGPIETDIQKRIKENP